jgi:hypothetical protein
MFNGRRPWMLIGRVPQGDEAHPAAMIPGYDEGVVNKDAVVDDTAWAQGTDVDLISTDPSGGHVYSQPAEAT